MAVLPKKKHTLEMKSGKEKKIKYEFIIVSVPIGMGARERVSTYL